MSHTEEDLKAAIIAIIGKERYDAHEADDNLVTVNEIACMTAFLKELNGPDVDIVRDCYRDVSYKGIYDFYRNSPKP